MKAVTKATILAQALPYIQEYHNKVVVVKYGGNAMIDENLITNVIEDICLMHLVGIKVVLVHGGGPAISEAIKKIGKESVFIDGLRYTDEETIDIVQQVMAGKINKDLVKRITAKGNRAIGISGLDNMLIEAKPIDEKWGYVGDIVEIHNDLLVDILEKDYIPVVAGVGMDKDGHTYNINADTVAAAIADSICAENLLVVSDIPGLLKDKDDESTLISHVKVDEIEALKNEGIIQGGMIPKVDCIVNAINGYCQKAVIIDGRVPHSLLIEIFSDEGIGTLFTK